MRTLVVAVLATIACTAGREAHAEDHGMFPIEEIARGLAGEKSSTRGLYVELGAGWQAKNYIAGHGAFGFAWGIYDSGLFATSSVYHVAAGVRGAARVNSETDDDAELHLLLLGGHSSYSLASAGLEGGIDVRVTDPIAVGPLVKARLGLGPLCLYVMTGVQLGDETELMFSLGLEVFRVPGG